MSDDNGHQVTPTVGAQQPGPVERGRYAVFETPDGGMAIARSGPLCENCAGCGCGEQADPIMVPAMAVQLWRAQQNGDLAGIGKLKAAARAMMAGG